jgi:hypothetical protein
MKKNDEKRQENKENPKAFPGYPHYPEKDDIYSKAKELEDVDPEHLTEKKKANEGADALNEKDFEDDMSGGDLDVPGAELDDAQEMTGGEDEENNYYSLGGDNHENLEEDKGE